VIAPAVVGAIEGGGRPAAVVVRLRPDSFPLAGRQIFQAQVRRGARAHYRSNADEKRSAGKQRIGGRLHPGRLTVRQCDRPASGGAHALDDGYHAGHETADALADHVRDQVYVRIPGQRGYEQNRTGAPDQRHGERKRAQHDAMRSAEYDARHVVEPGQQEHGHHAGSEHSDRQRPVVPVTVSPAPGAVQQRAYVSGLYGDRQVRRQIPPLGRALHEQR